MKKIFAILMSFQLILSPLALAQNIPGTNETSGVTNDAYLKTGNGSSGGLDFYTTQIAGIGTGMLGASIITQCLEGLKTPSIATFMAGSLVHVASEILGAKKKNDRNKKKIKDLELKVEEIKKSGDSAQLESLKAMLVEEQDTLEFLMNRKKWMIAVDVIYAAAVGLAITEEFYGLTTGNATATTACTAVLTATAASACAAANIPLGAGVAAATAIATAAPITVSIIPVVTAAAVAPSAATTASAAAVPFSAVLAAAIPPAILGCNAAIISGGLPLCVADYNAKMIATKANVVSHSTARINMKAYCNKDTSCVAASEAEMGVIYAACQEAPVDGGASMFSWTGLLSMAYGFGSGQLSKDGGKVSQYGSMAVSLLTSFVPAVSATVSKLYNFPIPRSITFGALLVMSGINTAGLAKREGISRTNVVRLQDGIAQFKVEANGEETGVGLDATIDPSGGNQSNSNNTKPNIKGLVVNQPKTCISNSGGKWDVSNKACGNPVKLSRPSFNKISLPVLNNVAGLSTDMAQALANGDEAKAYGIAGEIGSMAARVKQTSEELKGRYNELQKKNNKPTVDFNKKIKEQVAAIQNTMQQAAAKNNIDLASAGGNSLDAPEETKDSTPVVSAVAMPGIPQPAADPFAGMGGKEEYALEPAPAAAKANQNLNDFESAEEDVSKKSDVSIFTQVSQRYFLNYTKIFEKKKAPSPAVAEEPKKN
jgi:hypothetical protein